MNESSNNTTKKNENEVLQEKKETQNNSESILKPNETKKLEEKEHYELEYFSKEEFTEKIQNLEKTLEEKEEKLKDLQEENEKLKNKHMHLQAEFENAQKRWDKNRLNLRTEYIASALKSFLPLYDSFKKALESANETEKNILNGFYTQFMNIFKSHGAEPMHVDVNDEFDYNLHEALTSVEKEDLPENSIIEVVQDGWKYGKEIIRYAKVIISKKPKPLEPKPEKEKTMEKEAEKEENKVPIKEENMTAEKEIKEKKTKEKKNKKDKKKPE